MRYVALLRGIGPMNPNMRNEMLRSVMEKLGFKKVVTVISSGNIVFEASERDVAKLEAEIEAAWPEYLGFRSTTIVRSQQEFEKLAKEAPFEHYEDTSESRLHVTFVKHAPSKSLPLPHHGKDNSYEIIAMKNKVIYSVVDSTSRKTPDLMGWLEKQCGKEITTRSWRTVQRIVKRMKG